MGKNSEIRFSANFCRYKKTSTVMKENNYHDPIILKLSNYQVRVCTFHIKFYQIKLPAPTGQFHNIIAWDMIKIDIEWASYDQF